MKNIKVKAYLQTGVISDEYLPLDSILFYQKCRKLLGEETVTYSRTTKDEIEDIRLPIKIVNEGQQDWYYKGRRDWYYSCSFACWSKDTIQDSTFKVRSGDWIRHVDYLSENTKKVDISRGKFKNYHMKVFYRHASEIAWYMVCSDIEELKELLKVCFYIGKNGKDGWGFVKRWEIEEVEKDYSLLDENNNLMRLIPSDKGELLYGIRPPYWNQKNIRQCKIF